MRFFWFTAEMKNIFRYRKSLLEKSGFDYIAMGHIHKPQQVIPGLAAYAGALEPTDKNDTGKHGFIRGEIQKEALDLNLYHWQNGNICIWCSRQRAGWEMQKCGN